MTVKEARAELARLDARVTETANGYRAAKSAVREAWTTGRDLATELANHHKRRPGQVRDVGNADARKLTLDLVQRVSECDDLILQPIDPHRPALGLKIVDDRPARALAEAQDDATAARSERDAFAADCRVLLEEAAKRDAVDRVKEALNGKDPDALRDALVGVGVGNDGRATTNALTTADLR